MDLKTREDRTGQKVGTWMRRVLLIVTLAMGMYLILLVWSGLGPFLDALESMGRSHLLPAVVGLVLAGWVLRGVRWHLFTRFLGWSVPLPASLMVFFASFAFTATPGKVGEAVKAGLLKDRFDVPVTETLAVLLAERLGDLVAVLLLAMGGITLFSRAASTLLLCGAAILGITLLVVYRPLQRRVLGTLQRFGRIRPVVLRVDRFLLATASLYRPAPFLLGLTCALVAWSCEAWAFFMILSGTGAALPILTVFFVYGLSTLLGALSMLPGGIGGVEASMIFLLSLAGIPLTGAVPPVILMRAATLWLISAMGFAFLLLWWAAQNRDLWKMNLPGDQMS